MDRFLNAIKTRRARTILKFFFGRKGYISRAKYKTNLSVLNGLVDVGILYRNDNFKIGDKKYSEYFLNDNDERVKHLKSIFILSSKEDIEMDVLKDFFFAEYSFVVIGGRILGAKTGWADIYLVGGSITNSKKMRLDVYLEQKTNIVIDTEKNFVIKYLTGDKTVWEIVKNGYILKNDLPINDYIDLKPHNKKQWIHLQQQSLFL